MPHECQGRSRLFAIVNAVVKYTLATPAALAKSPTLKRAITMMRCFRGSSRAITVLTGTNTSTKSVTVLIVPAAMRWAGSLMQWSGFSSSVQYAETGLFLVSDEAAFEMATVRGLAVPALEDGDDDEQEGIEADDAGQRQDHGGHTLIP